MAYRHSSLPPVWAAVLCASMVLGRTMLLASPKCDSAEYRQFDFFAGDWDTYDVSDPRKVVARNRVTPMVDGCALREVYEQTDGMRGESFSTYDATRQLWHQSWVTNRGELLLLDGKLEGTRMVLSATERHADGSASLLRGIWWREGTSVRELAERSTNAGKTWTTVFDIVFRPHGSRLSAEP
jgi:hypothetical protein